MPSSALDSYLHGRAHLHFFKCQVRECRLEFMVLSWASKWPLDYKPYCPECGQQKVAFLRSVFTDEQICEVVYSDKWENNKKVK